MSLYYYYDVPLTLYILYYIIRFIIIHRRRISRECAYAEIDIFVYRRTRTQRGHADRPATRAFLVFLCYMYILFTCMYASAERGACLVFSLQLFTAGRPPAAASRFPRRTLCLRVKIIYTMYFIIYCQCHHDAYYYDIVRAGQKTRLCDRNSRGTYNNNNNLCVLLIENSTYTFSDLMLYNRF